MMWKWEIAGFSWSVFGCYDTSFHNVKTTYLKTRNSLSIESFLEHSISSINRLLHPTPNSSNAIQKNGNASREQKYETKHEDWKNIICCENKQANIRDSGNAYIYMCVMLYRIAHDSSQSYRAIFESNTCIPAPSCKV